MKNVYGLVPSGCTMDNVAVPVSVFYWGCHRRVQYLLISTHQANQRESWSSWFKKLPIKDKIIVKVMQPFA